MGTGKTSLMKMIESNLLLTEDVLFNWENIPGTNLDKKKLKDYLEKEFPNLQNWIRSIEFIKDRKAIRSKKTPH